MFNRKLSGSPLADWTKGRNSEIEGRKEFPEVTLIKTRRNEVFLP